ncbi:MAG: sulfatase-like hydrolase/transferase [Desulfobulbaceae bacterium]|nr:sulfatase-like hydrolase/transferase [Desulfobulbaceae bacterium]
MESYARSTVLRIYFSCTFIVVLLLCWNYLRAIPFADPWTIFFSFCTCLSYGAIYLLPAAMLTIFVHRLLTGWEQRKKQVGRWTWGVVCTVAVLTTSATTILLFADQLIYRILGFHLNGFVWNLITTPGGIGSMGGTVTANATYGAISTGFVILQILLMAVIRRAWLHGGFAGRPLPARIPLAGRKFFVAAIIAMALVQSVIYGLSNLQNRGPVLNAARAFPLYQPLTFRGLAKRLGYPVQQNPGLNIEPQGGRLVYPLAALAMQRPEKPLNIVWLVAESWRWDMLDPEIMPATWAFAHQASFFRQHYSGGNGTRMGMFTMFYGIHGAYWFRFLDERRSPVIMDVLQQQDYQLSMYTSAKFSYPEFDQTIFAGVPKAALHEADEGSGWQSDRKNVTDLLSFIRQRDPARPFMTFMFFESPHARYYFPPEDAIRQPYLENFNYATMSLAEDIGLIRNRYANACHHLDSQLARIIDFLREENLLDSTIVIITGDHGEELLENGNWGHNSAFTEQQTRVPLIIRVPGAGHHEIGWLTSHQDIVPTLLPLLGVTSPAASYSLGYNLLGQPERKYAVVSDWSRLAYVDSMYKAVFPLEKTALEQSRFTTRDDQELPEPAGFWQSHRTVLQAVVKELSVFQEQMN